MPTNIVMDVDRNVSSPTICIDPTDTERPFRLYGMRGRAFVIHGVTGAEGEPVVYPNGAVVTLDAVRVRLHFVNDAGCPIPIDRVGMNWRGLGDADYAVNPRRRHDCLVTPNSAWSLEAWAIEGGKASPHRVTVPINAANHTAHVLDVTVELP